LPALASLALYPNQRSPAAAGASRKTNRRAPLGGAASPRGSAGVLPSVFLGSTPARQLLVTCHLGEGVVVPDNT